MTHSEYDRSEALYSVVQKYEEHNFEWAQVLDPIKCYIEFLNDRGCVRWVQKRVDIPIRNRCRKERCYEREVSPHPAQPITVPHLITPAHTPKRILIVFRNPGERPRTRITSFRRSRSSTSPGSLISFSTMYSAGMKTRSLSGYMTAPVPVIPIR